MKFPSGRWPTPPPALIKLRRLTMPKVLPPAPKNVRIRVSDQVIPVELVYEGLDADGFHVWTSITKIAVPDGVIGAVLCDELPLNTTIAVDLE